MSREDYDDLGDELLKEEEADRRLTPEQKKFYRRLAPLEKDIFLQATPQEKERYMLSKSQEQRQKESSKRPGMIVLSKFYPRPFTERLLAEHDFTSEGDRGILYHCDPETKVWHSNGADFIRQYFRTTTDIIEDALKKRNFIEEIVADVQGITYNPDGLPEPDVNLIPCKNGVYNIITRDFRPLRKTDHFTWTLPWNYKPHATCTYLKKLINSTLPDPAFLWDLIAYCLYRGYPLQKFFILIGRGRNGKGVFQVILIRLLGHANVSNVGLADFDSNRFAASELHRRLANISSEENYGDIENTRTLKMLTGGDQIQADVKYKGPVKFVNYAKIIISINQLSKTHDTTDGFFRRVAIQEFPHQFVIDPAIDIKIREESDEMTHEYEGLLVLALERLTKLKANNFTFSGASDFESARKKYLELSNPISQFLDEMADRTCTESDYIFKFEFLEQLNTWLRDRGFNTISANKLGREMNNLGFEDGRKDFDGQKRYFAWVGLRWKAMFDKNVKDVTEVKALYNNLSESKRSCSKKPEFLDILDKTFEEPPVLDGEA